MLSLITNPLNIIVSVLVPVQISLEIQHLRLTALNPLLLKYWCLHGLFKLPFWKYIWIPFSNIISLAIWTLLASELCTRFQTVLKERGFEKPKKPNKKNGKGLLSYGFTHLFKASKEVKEEVPEEKLFLFEDWTTYVLNLNSSFDLPFVIDHSYEILLHYIVAVKKEDAKTILASLRTYFNEIQTSEGYDMLDDIFRPPSDGKGLITRENK
ncbi:HFL174Wp [Eremothecium sinecaudum]|uniref:HFL174Wp n=1 Tax=Eremothecium sinecaudum TaxID=45286 RepID=A0A0X8HUB7_9SACH|nr:HFL174Wp [Eremothecium sinecaudum]AMD21682.1 HFL174Wp [Eremothecium sinecaudum]